MTRKGSRDISPIIAILVLVSIVFTYAYRRQIQADTATTQVTVSNTAPIFSVAPAESPASDSTNPTNAGNQVTFTATATDTNGDSYRLAICKTDAITPNGTSSPTCTGGAWCTSSSTTSGSNASCSYTTSSGNVESNDWYAFVCDVVSGSTCSSSQQGSGSSGSPFAVNHAPIFTAMSSGSAAPGGNITFTSTANDADVDGSADSVKLIVCSTAGATANGCTVPANEMCASSLVATNPSCSYTLPAVIQDGNVTYYSYIFDSHNLGATNNPLSGQTYTVNNVAPVVSNVILNGGNPVSLTAGAATNITVTGTITDSNSCQDITSVKTSVYRSGVGYSACDTAPEFNYNYCYALVNCTVSAGTCTGATDASSDYSCTVSVQFNADATVTSTLYDAENWLATLKANDSTLGGTAETASGVEMNTLTALSIDTIISYGNVPLGTDTGSTNANTTVSALGNVGIDVDVSGTDMTNGSDTIPVANQKYDIAAFSYGTGGTPLSMTQTLVPLHVQKTTNYAAPASKLLYWGISIPAGIGAGSYSGTNTITARMSNTLNW